MSQVMIIAIAVAVIAIVAGGLVLLVGAIGLVAVLVRRRRAATPPPVPREPEVRPEPAPLTRLSPTDTGTLHPEALEAPVPPDDGTEEFPRVQELFERLDRQAEEDSTELLSQADRERLYGEEGPDGPERADFRIEEDGVPGKVVARSDS